MDHRAEVREFLSSHHPRAGRAARLRRQPSRQWTASGGGRHARGRLGIRQQVEVDGLVTALRSATSVNADLIGRPDLGRVRAGCVADLLIVDGDPVANPSLLWGGPEHRMVIRVGVPIGG